jgi:hypothetical protein
MQDCCGLVMAFSPFAPKALTCEVGIFLEASTASEPGTLVLATPFSADAPLSTSMPMASTAPITCESKREQKGLSERQRMHWGS